jgi:hypothetical protein
MVPAATDECGCTGCPTFTCPTSCVADKECGDGMFCQMCQGSDTGSCKPHQGLGQVCAGFMPCQEQCQPHLACVPTFFPKFGPQIADLPSICCPQETSQCSCADHEVMVVDENGCNTCKCVPGPCGKSMPATDEFCSANSPCQSKDHTCVGYKSGPGDFENHVCCPVSASQCTDSEQLVEGSEGEKCCPRVTCRMHCPLGWAWEAATGCSTCACFTPPEDCAVAFDGCNTCEKTLTGDWVCRFLKSWPIWLGALSISVLSL